MHLLCVQRELPNYLSSSNQQNLMHIYALRRANQKTRRNTRFFLTQTLALDVDRGARADCSLPTRCAARRPEGRGRKLVRMIRTANHRPARHMDKTKILRRLAVPFKAVGRD